MRRFIFILVILGVSVFAGLKIAEDPGYAIFAYRYWTVEMPLWFAILCLFVGLLVLYFILRFFDAVDSSWISWKNWLALRRKNKSYSKTNRGLLELIEANWKNAETLLMEGVDQSDAPLINFLAAAKAAHEQKSYEKRDLYLRRAYDLSPQTHTAVGLMQAELQIKQGKLDQALATLNRLHTQEPKQVLVLKLLERVYVHLGDWKNVLKLIPLLYKTKQLTAEQMSLLEVKAYKELLSATRKSIMSQSAKDIWREIPKKLQKNPDLVCCYVKQLQRYPDTNVEIEDLIQKTLKNAWQPELVIIYGTLNLADANKQLKTAESWQKSYGSHAEIYLTLARLSVNCQLWGKAKSYFQEALRLGSTAEVYYEYGNLLMRLDESHAAMQNYREGLKVCYSAAQ